MTDVNKQRVLLPQILTPKHYDLKLTPDLERYTFEGEVVITGDVKESFDRVTLHAKELTFDTNCAYVLLNGKKIKATEIIINLKLTTVTFVFEEKVTKFNDCVQLEIKFHGILNNQMAGFYRSSYKDILGKSKIMASTQFEALDARRCFPCFDEPAMKATFTLTLVIPDHLSSLSNMPVETLSSIQIEDKPFKEVKYMKTPIMSTYLLAFVVGEFDSLTAYAEKSGTVINVYTPPGKSHMGKFALDSARKCLDFYDDFFGVPYPLPKLDMIAIPEFAAGAMENWGLVTYREVDLLIDSQNASQSQKQRVCVVVAHELAHQWFGNLVTFQWWDDLWLNEGFASFMENYSIFNLFPAFNYIWDEFASTGHLAAALRLDALRSSHPIQVPIYHAEEVEEVFDAISYCKGSCVVRMAYNILGDEIFQKGLGIYFDKFKYSNTETCDLWEAWEAASATLDGNNLPVAELMRSWTEQVGFPLLKVVDEKWSEDEVTLSFEQEWFLSDGSSIGRDEKKTWCIPIFVRVNDEVLSSVTWMREDTCTVALPINDKDTFIKLNADQNVPMRVMHTPTMLSRMSAGIKNQSLPVTDRAGLLMDQYAFLKANKLDTPVQFFQLLGNYTEETNAIVWEGIESLLGTLDKITSQIDVKMNKHFQSFAKKLILSLTKIVSWDASENDDNLTILLRGSMIRLLSRFCADDAEVKEEASKRFSIFKEDASTRDLPSDYRTPVFKIVLKNGGVEEFETIQAYFDTATDQAEKKRVLSSLGATRDFSLKLRTLEWAISGKIKLQDFFYPMGAVSASSKEGLDLSWSFFKDNVDKIETMVGSANPSIMSAVVANCCGGFCSNEAADEIEQYFKETHPLPKCERKIAQIIESIRGNSKLLDQLRSCKELYDAAFWESL